MNNNQCPKCASENLVEGVQRGQASVLPKGSVFKGGSAMIHLLCADCGFILESYVKKPKKFK